MNAVVDLHSHSPYAGASGKTDFNRLRYVMKSKGIDIYGSGDILLEKWEQELDAEFPYINSKGLWKIGESTKDALYLMPQTEVIVTLPYLHDLSKRKLFHLVILFRNKKQLPAVRKLFANAGSKLGIGRPFIKFESSQSMCDFFENLKSKTSCIYIPAHIMTPDGILGGKNPVDKIEDIFGDRSFLIDALESGLGADPAMINRIAGALNVPVISSSDAHSAALNRLGREFTHLKLDNISADSVADSVLKGDIIKTAEFPPFEGRYYLTGHRGDRPGHNGEEIFFTDISPEVCPICGKKLVKGVKELAEERYKKSKQRKQDFIYQIPLVDVISESIGSGSNSAKVTDIYLKIISQTENESHLWLDNSNVKLTGIPEAVVEGINRIKNRDYKIKYGFDGQYGRILL